MNFYLIQDVIRNDVKNFGVSKTFHDLTFRAVNQLVDFKVLNCITISNVDPRYLKGNENYTYAFLTPDRLYELAKNEEHELPNEFIQPALRKGDECYAILDGDVVASYGWYSNSPTDISHELRLHFSDQYIYMYKGYTHHQYRGQRLHAIGMTLALKQYLSRGFKGLVSYVESTNYSSLKSVQRMGYQDFGKIYILKSFGKYLIYCNQGCAEYGFRLERLYPDSLK
jgi:hypothetical protein